MTAAVQRFDVFQPLLGQFNRTAATEEVTARCFDGLWWFIHRVVKSCAGVSEESIVSFFRATDKPDLRLTLLHTKRTTL
jgi:hypothetical protein